MNILSNMLDVVAAHKVFKFHPKCKKISLTHLCLADDLLIFIKGRNRLYCWYSKYARIVLLFRITTEL